MRAEAEYRSNWRPFEAGLEVGVVDPPWSFAGPLDDTMGTEVGVAKVSGTWWVHREQEEPMS